MLSKIVMSSSPPPDLTLSFEMFKTKKSLTFQIETKPPSALFESSSGFLALPVCELLLKKSLER